MPSVVEFRIALPLSVDEFHRGQMHMVAQKSLEVSSEKADEGIEWIRNEPYDNTDGHWGVSPISGIEAPRTKGQYTLKRYHIKSKIPGVAAALAPANMLYLVEEAWNAYPHCKTVMTNGYLDKAKFHVVIETVHSEDMSLENAVGLSAEELKVRKIETIDLVDAYADKKHKDYNPKYDVTLVKSAKTGRGPLAKGWEKTVKPVMMAYKVVRVSFAYWGLGSIEGTIINAQRNIFGQTLSQSFATLDDWVEKSMTDIRAMEEEVARRSAKALEKMREKGEITELPDAGYQDKRAPTGTAAAGGGSAAAAVGGAGAS